MFVKGGEAGLAIHCVPKFLQGGPLPPVQLLVHGIPGCQQRRQLVRVINQAGDVLMARSLRHCCGEVVSTVVPHGGLIFPAWSEATVSCGLQRRHMFAEAKCRSLMILRPVFALRLLVFVLSHAGQLHLDPCTTQSRGPDAPRTTAKQNTTVNLAGM